MPDERIKGLAEAAAKFAAASDGDGDSDATPDGDADDVSHNPELEAAMVDMAGEYRKALKGDDDKALAHVLMAMFECCASMPPAPELE